ncbi:hypothetical protein LUZ60_001633 [Juncus effusus]|nr:hypothetical protein LUZ60_001633 [Juncus effusus]
MARFAEAEPWLHFHFHFLALFSFLLWISTVIINPWMDQNAPVRVKKLPELPLRFRHDGSFKILQVADMHFGNGLATRCRDIPQTESLFCTDLNTTHFLTRLILAEKPDLVVFTGDNIFGSSATDAAESLLIAFKPVINHKIAWASVLGNHDQESTMTRFELMNFMSLMDYSISQINPTRYEINGFGNYYLGINGPFGSEFVNQSLMNLYLLDSGDREEINGVKTYGFIKDSQLSWLQNTSQKLQERFSAPALAFFHIPIPEIRELWSQGYIGNFQEAVACSRINSGVLNALIQMGDVKSVFLGHDHLNDFCGKLKNKIWFCYGGGFGYHGYGKIGWERRGRVIFVKLGKVGKEWGQVAEIRTWKRLDGPDLRKVDEHLLWRRD